MVLTRITSSTLAVTVAQFLKSDVGIALLVTLAWKVVMLLVGYFLDAHLNNTAPSLLHHTVGWDSNWYMIIVADHYLTNMASAAFYPLFPLLVEGVRLASFSSLDVLIAGQIVTTFSVWFLILGLLKIGGYFFKQERSFWLVALVLCAPAAFFMHVFYSEALFMAISLWAYIFALRHQWLYMGILLGILTLTRLPALLVVGLCGLEFMRAYEWNIRKVFNKNLLYFLLAPLGFAAYGTYLAVTRGDFFGMFHAYQATGDWSYQVFDSNFIKTILRVSYEVFRALIGERPLDLDIFINHFLPLLSLLILGSCSLYLILKKQGKFIPLGIFGLVSIVMFTLNSNVVSVHRYIFPCLTVYIGLILLTKGKYQHVALLFICTAGLILQFLLLALFVSNTFVG